MKARIQNLFSSILNGPQILLQKKILNKIDIKPAGVEDMTEFEFHFPATLLLKYPFRLSNQSP